MVNPIRASGGGVIIDRRGESSGKQVSNQQRFRDRHGKQIQEQMDRLIRERGIKDATSEGQGVIRGTTSEPTFGIDRNSGERNIITPGSRGRVVGDSIAKPKGGGKGSGAGNGGEGEDDFVFTLTRKEMLEYLFDGLELPNQMRKLIADADDVRYFRAGFSKSGNPSLIHVQRTFKEGLARRIAAKGGKQLQIEDIEEELSRLRAERHYGPGQGSNDPEIAELEDALKELRALKIPYFLEEDLRYRAQQEEPLPVMKAVMFCLMDVSGSMGESEKFIAKKFFILLYLFLTTNYDRIELVFIRHHTTAQEVDEETFFYDKESGGTVVSSALYLMKTIIEARYATSDWNIYAAQASDGDNWQGDSPICTLVLDRDLLPIVQYFAYIEIAKKPQDLFEHYKLLAKEWGGKFAVRRVQTERDVYPVFRKLFEKKGAKNESN